MILKYKRFPSDDPAFPFFLRAMVPMRLFRGPASVPILGQLDTGADQTLINKEIADALYVDWKSGTKSFTNGITGKPVPYYLHDLEIEVDGLPDSRVRTRAGFVDLRNVGVLLG